MAETIQKLTCNRCGYAWFPRSTQPPQKCARCRSRYWNKTRVYVMHKGKRVAGNQPSSSLQ
jgi:predicted Zn-ribbon and HTH transcriptional regulator